MGLRGFITTDNIYYESGRKFSEDDIEVPVRPSPLHTWDDGNWKTDEQNVHAIIRDEPDYFYVQKDYKGNTMSQKGMFDNISWKDLITIVYFLAGMAGMWLHMSERTVILEQKIQHVDKEIQENKNIHSVDTNKLELSIRDLQKQVTDLSITIVRERKERRD